MRLVVLLAAVVLATAAPVAAEPSPSPAVIYPDDPDLQEAYESGFGAGYDDGYVAGQTDVDRTEDEADLRDQVESEATATPTPTPTPVEGGQDLGDEVDPYPDPLPEETDEGSGIPWWPLAFAVVVSVWFVTRRRRLDDGES